MHTELQNTIVYGGSPLERTGSAYEWRAKTYGTPLVQKQQITFTSEQLSISDRLLSILLIIVKEGSYRL